MGRVARGALAAGVFTTLTILCGCQTGAPPKDVPVVTKQDARVGRFGSWAEVPAQSPPLNVILFTLDTTRQDHLSCYGFAGKTSPAIDGLAAEGVQFDHAVSPIPCTLPSHSSIMTGLYPYQHGVRYNGTYSLADRFTTLAEILKARGYETAAVVGGFPVDHRFGIAQGFDFYEDNLPAAGHGGSAEDAKRPGSDVTRLARQWLGQPHSKPFFLWLHYYDAHIPYNPPEPFRSRFPGDPYSGEISYMDSCLGDVIADLKASGVLDHSLILLVGDHGESLGEHRELTHSMFIYNSTQRIPFIIRPPRGGPWDGPAWRGKRVEELVSLVDCLPTVLNFIGLPDGERPLCMGESLIPVVEGHAPGHPWVYLESLAPKLEYGWSDLRALETPRWKYIHAPRPELYDEPRDRPEAVNVAARKTPQAAVFETDLAVLAAQDVGAEAGQVPMDEETMERLRSLGYIHGAPASTTGAVAGTLLDPKDKIGVYEQINRAEGLVANGRMVDALAVADSILSGNPETFPALRVRAACLVQLNRGAEAVPVYEKLLAATGHGPEELELLQDLVLADLSAGRTEDARHSAEILISAHPQEKGLHLLLAQVYEKAGNLSAARAAISEEIRLQPKSVDALLAAGDGSLAARDSAGAEREYGQALQVDQNSADALVRMGEFKLAKHLLAEARELVDRALAADPQNAMANFRKGWFARMDGNAPMAIQYYQRALQTTPDNEMILYNLGNAYFSSGDLVQAQRAYEATLQTGRAPAEAHVNLGAVYAQRGNLAGAIKEWEQALALDPQNHNADSIRRNIQMAHQQLGR